MKAQVPPLNQLVQGSSPWRITKYGGFKAANPNILGFEPADLAGSSFFVQTGAVEPRILMENDKQKSRLNQIPDDLFTRDEVSKPKQELNQIGNANFWPGPLSPLGKATTDIEKKIKYLEDKSRGW